MKKFNLLVVLFILLFTTQVRAQIGINTTEPDGSAALDIVSSDKGILIPRMTTVQKIAIPSPASGLLVYDTDLKCISQNEGTPDSPSWVCLSGKDTQSSSFYMPSIAIDASAVVTGQPLDLYAEYKKQFNTPTVASTDAPDSIPFFETATDLYYYITYYDDTVLKINSLSSSGVLNYDILKEADYHTFINVVFVVK